MDKLNKSQQRIYDLLKGSYPEWQNKAQLRKRYYPDQRESYDVYMGRLLAELDHLGLIKKRTAQRNGELLSYSEYSLKTPQEASEAPQIKKEVLHVEPEKSESRPVDFHQEDKLCECKKSWWIKNGKCNKCGVEREQKEIELPTVKPKHIKQLWNKKLHRYLTQDEIKSGMLGG
jgi:hypothetical protein